MNSWGRLFRVSLFGESHGPAVGVVIDGCPAGTSFPPPSLAEDLFRRRSGEKGTTARREEDRPRVLSGVFRGRTTGSPLTLIFENEDVDSSSYEALRHTPRPSHADLVARVKYGGFADYRGGGHFSGRLTAALVAAGSLARALVAPVKISADLLEAGGSAEVEAAVSAARAEGDSIGGLIECRAAGLPPGLGEPFFDSLESLLAHLLFSVPGVKGVEFGAGFAGAGMKGSRYNDPILTPTGQTGSNNSGGINGGISNGNEMVFRVALRPTASISLPQATVDLRTGAPAEIRIGGRHDACIALRAPVVIEAAAALVLCDLMMLEGLIPRVKESGDES